MERAQLKEKTFKSKYCCTGLSCLGLLHSLMECLIFHQFSIVALALSNDIKVPESSENK